MALNSSGPISLAGSTAGQSIAVELGLSATGQISLNDSAVRGLAGVPSGAITMPTNFWGKSNTYIDPTAIPLAMYGTGVYSMRVGRFNWNTGTFTNITQVSNWYSAGNGAQNPSCVLDPSGNLWMGSYGMSPNSSWYSFAYLAKGGSSVSLASFSPISYEYGVYISTIAWNTSYGYCVFNLAPHSAEADPTPYRCTLAPGPSPAIQGTSQLAWGGGWPVGLTQLRSIDTSGKPTLSGSILGIGEVYPNDGTIRAFIGSGTTFPAPTGSGLFYSGNGSFVAPTSTSSGVMVSFRYCYTYPGYTNITNIGTIGGANWVGVAPLANGAFAGWTNAFTTYSPNNKFNVFSNASTSPTWTTDLSGILGSYRIAHVIGAGDTIYVLAGTGESGGTFVLFRFVFNLSTGSYTSSSYSLGVTYNSNCYSGQYDVC